MLSCLRIRELAIIEELEVSFGPGLNVVTGETGAGKSILVQALHMVLGARGRPELLRTGAAQAEVEASFEAGDDPSVRAFLAEAGLFFEEEEGEADGEIGEVILRRVLRASGRSRAYINNRMVSAGQLGELSSRWVEIASQHEHQSLSDASTHLGVLDAYAGHEDKVEALGRAFDALSATGQALQEARRRVQERAQREDFLRFQLAEIEEIRPEEGEEEELSLERDRLSHAERLLRGSAEAEREIYARDGAMAERLARLASEMEDLAEIDPALRSSAELLRSAEAQLVEAAHELGGYARSVRFEPERLARIEERLYRLRRLVRKHGGTLAEVLHYAEEARGELHRLEALDEEISSLEAAEARAFAVAAEGAQRLRKARKRAAKKLAKEIEEELATLGMAAARVELRVDPLPPREGAREVEGSRLSRDGLDRAELRIAPNPGEESRPLSKIASGGELSRTLLAIKRVIARQRSAGVYVFDEVDTGVGGAVAEVIGQKLAEVARHHQVICVTHLPQIAAYADRHFRVLKEVQGKRTKSRIVPLSEVERLEELARMLGGIEITGGSRRAAEEMLQLARAAR